MSATIIIPKPRLLYWAYGSNLCVEDMKRRCPRAEQYRKLYVGRGRLVFRGVADVEGAEEDSKIMVAGGLWKVTDRCIEALDRYEGVSSGLYSKRYLPLEIDGRQEDALFYKMNMKGIQPPWESYLATIQRGYRDFKLDEKFLKNALNHSWGNLDKTEELKRRWLAKGSPSLARVLRRRKK